MLCHATVVEADAAAESSAESRRWRVGVGRAARAACASSADPNLVRPTTNATDSAPSRAPCPSRVASCRAEPIPSPPVLEVLAVQLAEEARAGIVGRTSTFLGARKLDGLRRRTRVPVLPDRVKTTTTGASLCMSLREGAGATLRARHLQQVAAWHIPAPVIRQDNGLYRAHRSGLAKGLRDLAFRLSAWGCVPTTPASFASRLTP